MNVLLRMPPEALDTKPIEEGLVTLYARMGEGRRGLEAARAYVTLRRIRDRFAAGYRDVYVSEDGLLALASAELPGLEPLVELVAQKMVEKQAEQEPEDFHRAPGSDVKSTRNYKFQR